MQSLLKTPLGRQPPVAASIASCSGRAPVCVHCPSLRSNRRRVLEPCRITTTAAELYASDEAKRMGLEPLGDQKFMDFPDEQLFQIDEGPFEKRIQLGLDEALASNKVNMRDMEYWFNPPKEGWKGEEQRLHFLEEVEAEFPHPWHPPDEDDDAPNRISYSQLEEGKIYLGVISDVWLYHGVQVDIGAEFDGLIPCNEELWETAVEHMDVGQVVMVEVHKLRVPGLYRWPVQVKFTQRTLQDMMLPPDDYTAPVDHSWAEAMGWSPEDVAEVAGRTLDTPTYFVPPDEQKMAEEIIDGYGTGDMYWREKPSLPVEDYIDDPLADPAHVAWMDERAEEVAIAGSSLAGDLL